MDFSGDHNRLDRDTASRVAFELRELLALVGSASAPTDTDDSLGPLGLVDSLADAPANTISPAVEAVHVYAIDGGSTVLGYGGSVEVIAWRAGRVHFLGRDRRYEQCPPPEVLACEKSRAVDIIAEYGADLPYRYNSELPPQRAVDELRWLSEWRLIKRTIEEAEPNALVLIDGSLRSNPGFDLDTQRRLMREAADHEVHVAAITKQSGLTIGRSMSIDGMDTSSADDGCWYRRLNRDLPEQSGWLGNVYLARLHPYAGKSYRIDINRYDKDIDTVFSMIASVSDDIEFAGYPYPLVAAHRLARIDRVFRNEMNDKLEQALEAAGVPNELWQYLTRDIHDRLNADIAAGGE